MTTDQLVQRIEDGRTDLVWDLVESGHSPGARTRGGASILQWCAYFGDVSAIRFLLHKGESLESLGTNLGLNGAAFHGHWRLCEYLIEHGAGVNAAAANTGETPLHAALATPHRDAHDLVVAVLVGHGADPNMRTVPLVETGSFMRDSRTKGETALHRAALFGTADTIDLLLEAGADREARDMNGDTPLSWASWASRPDEVLRRLCYGTFSIHPGRPPMRLAVLGKPHCGS